MSLARSCVLVSVLILAVAAGQAAALEVTLYEVSFPERRDIDLEFTRTRAAPQAQLKAEVKHREGRAVIEVKYRDMKPAVLFSGDVTSYVMWAVTRDGGAENLGELWVRENDDKVEFSTGLKGFALMVTAESYPLVDSPSELVVFTSSNPSAKNVVTTRFAFSEFKPAPKAGMESIANIAWDSDRPLDLMQAEKAFELAEREDAKTYATQVFNEAEFALAQARAYANARSRTKEILDTSRRVVSLSSEAIQMTLRRKEREEIERQIEERRHEMESLESRAREAEQSASAAQLQLEQAELALNSAKLQQEAADAAVARAQGELGQLQAERAALELSVAELAARAERLQQEREQLADRLQSALSEVADVHDSARGFIVNLPDILFDIDKAALKPDAKIVIAKLTGILLIMPELNLRVEGHTDSTGSPEHNQRLSEQRAASVRDFLAQQGIVFQRMVSVGYGLSRPIADNSTTEGRRKNRRVEVIIARGEIGEAQAP